MPAAGRGSARGAQTVQPVRVSRATCVYVAPPNYGATCYADADRAYTVNSSTCRLTTTGPTAYVHWVGPHRQAWQRKLGCSRSCRCLLHHRLGVYAWVVRSVLFCVWLSTESPAQTTPVWGPTAHWVHPTSTKLAEKASTASTCTVRYPDARYHHTQRGTLCVF
jgi:hypothetical protein